MPAKGSRKDRCLRGHDTSSPDARTRVGNCKECSRLDAIERRRRNKERTELHSCPRCGDVLPWSECSATGYCKPCAVERSLEWQAENPERFRALMRASLKRRNDELRLECVEGYGGKCVCCGEAEEVFLEFDHVNDDGKEHRAALGSGASRDMWWRWLIKNNFPPEIQLLCANCHTAKTKRGVCPHQREVSAVDFRLQRAR
jgi:hypothetical protein